MKSYFHVIYKAAQEKNAPLLMALLASRDGVCVDEREADGDFLLSAAGQLASKGDLESALFLVNHFGASTLLVIYGLHYARQTDDANRLMICYGVTK